MWRRSVMASVVVGGLAVAGALVLSCRAREDRMRIYPEPEPSTRPTATITTRSVVRMDPIPSVVPGTEVKRAGDEIMVAGRLFHTGTRVILWTDPGGYDAYRTERRFVPWGDAQWVSPKPGVAGGGVPAGQPASPQRYGLRRQALNWAEFEQVRGGGWTLELLQKKIDQFVIHYDVVGAAKYTFKVLHDDRALSIHFMLDIDGTIYQTLDVKERAFHATISNDRSVGIEIANRGAYTSDIPLREFYAKDEQGPYISFPARFGDGGVLVPGTYRPIRPELVRGTVNGDTYVMYDLTPQQYAALARLTAALCTALPRITLDYPKDMRGKPLMSKLPAGRFDRWQGLLGHYNVQEEKNDPGPAFQWEKVVGEARAMMSDEALAANRKWSRSPVRPGPLATQPVVPTPPKADGKATTKSGGAGR